MEQPRKATVKDKHPVHCNDCVHSYDPFEIGADGKPFLVHCKKIKFATFLDMDYLCDYYQQAPCSLTDREIPVIAQK